VALIFVTFDQLNRKHGALASADPAQDQIVMVESRSMLQARAWHHQRLHFLLSSGAHFREELRTEGFTVHHIEADTISQGLAQFDGEHIRAAAPSSRGMRSRLKEAGVELVASDFFLTPEAEFSAWVSTQKSLVMENFYRWQRRRLNVLMEGEKPAGGRWNYDEENRLAPPRGEYDWPTPLHHQADAIDSEVEMKLAGRSDLLGSPPRGIWATTRSGALKQLTYFLDVSLPYFGPYEDAMPTATWIAHHSLLSPYLNVGLLHPREVIDAALKRFEAGEVPIASIEGFVRQLIGWREYVNGLYWHFPDDYRHSNHLKATRKLLPLFDDPTATDMNCVRSIVTDVHDRAWVHHIPRLMVLSNLALLAGVNPGEYLDWMRRMFIDAADWVMVPNVIGMGVHADGGIMMTKPYAAGGAYIKRMGQYCGSCRFDPTIRTGEKACPFTTLYWDFLDRHRAQFAANHRMGQQVRGIDRLRDLSETKARAQEVLEKLERGAL
jgi:deoxyribodipyrimidine photolyase-related protein